MNRWEWVAELASVASVDPWPLTLRELIAAAKAKQRYDWDHTAELMSLMANLHTTGRYNRDHFHPTREAPKTLMYESDPAAEYERLIKEGKNA